MLKSYRQPFVYVLVRRDPFAMLDSLPREERPQADLFRGRELARMAREAREEARRRSKARR